MFICESCKQPSAPRERANAVVVKTRPVRYAYRAKSQRFKEPFKPLEMKDDPGGVGHETVREEKWCGKCLNSTVPPVLLVRDGAPPLTLDAIRAVYIPVVRA